MTKLEQIITERLENAHNDYRRCLEDIDMPIFMIDEVKGSILAYQDCLNLMQPRTEADILKDFEKLGYKMIKMSTAYLFENTKEDRRIWIHTDLKEYCISIENMPLAYRTFTMQEHKLLNELFEVWRW
jgi:hypothetical protein